MFELGENAETRAEQVLITGGFSVGPHHQSMYSQCRRPSDHSDKPPLMPPTLGYPTSGVCTYTRMEFGKPHLVPSL